jgi:hypothetical protein
LIDISPLRESRSFRPLWFGQVESGVVADVVSPEFSVISGGIATVASVGLVALRAPELVSYRAPAPELREGSSRDA